MNEQQDAKALATSHGFRQWAGDLSGRLYVHPGGHRILTLEQSVELIKTGAVKPTPAVRLP